MRIMIDLYPEDVKGTSIEPFKKPAQLGIEDFNISRALAEDADVIRYYPFSGLNRFYTLKDREGGDDEAA